MDCFYHAPRFLKWKLIELICLYVFVWSSFIGLIFFAFSLHNAMLPSTSFLRNFRNEQKHLVLYKYTQAQANTKKSPFTKMSFDQSN